MGAPWPVGRDAHAACCLNYGDDEPILLMTGGLDEYDNTLKDAWLLDITFQRWREVREVYMCMGLCHKYLTITTSFPGHSHC